MEQNDFNKAARNEPQASDYLDMLDNAELTDEQANELLDVLFEIMKSFVLMGYGMEPVNKLLEGFEKSALGEPTMVEFEYDKDECNPENDHA